MQENNLLCLPKKIYFKKGCTPVALRELKEVYHLRTALLISDPHTFQVGTVGKIDKLLRKQGFRTSTFFSFSTIPTFAQVLQVVTQIELFSPEAIIGIGGNCAMSAAKLAVIFEACGKKSERKLVLIPTSFSSAGETSSFVIIHVENKDMIVRSNNSVADISITDGDFIEDLTPEQIKDSLLFFDQVMAQTLHKPDSNTLTKGLYEEALGLINKYKVPALEGDSVAKEKLQNAITMMGSCLTDVK